MSEDILTEEHLCPIADHWTRGGLIEWLKTNGIPYVVARSGWPRVHRKALERAMGVQPDVGGVEVKEAAFKFGTLEASGFNFDALK